MRGFCSPGGLACTWCSLREPTLRRFRSPGGLACSWCSLRERALRRFRSPGELACTWCSLRERALRRFRSPGELASFSYASAGDQQGDASRRAPLTPGSGLLHRRFAVPSLLPDFLRTGGTRHPWRESLIRSAALTASLPAFNSSFCVGYVIALSRKNYLWLSAWKEGWPSTLFAGISYFCVDHVIAVSPEDYLRLSAGRE